MKQHMKFIFRILHRGFEIGLIRHQAKETQVFFYLSIGYGHIPNYDSLGLFLFADLLNLHLKEGEKFRIGKHLILKVYNHKTKRYENIKNRIMKELICALMAIIGAILLGITIVIEGKISFNNPWYFYSMGGAVCVFLSGFLIGLLINSKGGKNGRKTWSKR